MPKGVVGSQYKGKVRRRLPMEGVDINPATSSERVSARPSDFQSNISRVCGIPVRRRGLLQTEIEALCIEYDVHGVPESDDENDLVEGPLFYGDDDEVGAVGGEPVVGEGDEVRPSDVIEGHVTPVTSDDEILPQIADFEGLDNDPDFVVRNEQVLHEISSDSCSGDEERESVRERHVFSRRRTRGRRSGIKG